jgi:hypothetical protein
VGRSGQVGSVQLPPSMSSPGGKGSGPGAFPNAKRLAVHTLCGVAEERKSAQWARLAFFMAEKYWFLSSDMVLLGVRGAGFSVSFR